MAHISQSEASIVCCSSWVSFVLFLGLGSVGVIVDQRSDVASQSHRVEVTVVFLFSLRYQWNYRFYSLYSYWNPPFPAGSLGPTYLYYVYIYIFICTCSICHVQYLVQEKASYVCIFICSLRVHTNVYSWAAPQAVYCCVLSFFNGKTYTYSSPFTGQPFFVDFRPLRMRAHLRHIPDICPLEVCPIASFHHKWAFPQEDNYNMAHQFFSEDTIKRHGKWPQ